MIDATLVTKLQMPMQKVRDLMESAMLAYYSALCAFDLGMSLSGFARVMKSVVMCSDWNVNRE